MPQHSLAKQKRKDGVVRYFDEKGKEQRGQALEIRETKARRKFVVMKRVWAHRRHDGRLARYVAVPVNRVIDDLPNVK